MIADSSYSLAVVETASDTVDFRHKTCDAIYVGGTGHVTAVLPNDDTVLFSAVPVGTILPIKAKRINATSTTATLFVVLYR